MEPNVGKKRGGRGRVLTIILIVITLVTLAAFSYSIAAPRTGERFSEFYVLGLNGKASDYPTQLRAGEEGEVVLGIVNHEQEVMTYWVEVKAGEKLLSEIGPLRFPDGGQWQEVIGFTLSNSNSKQKVEFLLYKFGLKEPYRSLYLWVEVQ